MYIDKNKIKQTHEVLGDGSFSRVFLVKFKRQKYAYKVFDSDVYFVDEHQAKRFEELCKKYDNSNILLPKYLVGKENINSYLLDYYKGECFSNLFSYPTSEKIKYLHFAKDLLIKTNDDKGIIHSDIHLRNIMFNRKEGTIALIDFDNAKTECLEPYKYCLNERVKYYLHYNNYDKFLDIYMFNILTFALLNNISMDKAFYNLNNPKYSQFFTSKHALKVLDDISIYKKNGNYLIDMIDDSKILKY